MRTANYIELKVNLRKFGMAICLSVGLVQHTQAAELSTPRYRISITNNCSEGVVVCDNVTYLGVNKNNGNSIELKGTTRHAPCGDGVTPCRFLGYSFNNDGTTYFVSADGNLVVTDSQGYILLQEQGSWDY